MEPKSQQKVVIQGIGFAVLATLIWSGNFIIARGVIKTIPPVTLAFYRWFSATLLILPLAWKKLVPGFQFLKKNPLYFLLVAVSGISIFNTFVYIAGHYTGAINMVLVGTTSSPIFSVILAAVFLHEKITRMRVAGMLACIAGIFLLLSKGSWSTLMAFSFTRGDWWMLGAGLAFAIYIVSARKKPAAMDSVAFLFYVFALGTLMLAPFYGREWLHAGGISINLANISAILYLGLGTSVICFFLWNKSIASLGAGRASLFGNLIPVFSTVEAVLILGEQVHWFHMAGFVLVVTGLVLANLPFQPRNPVAVMASPGK